MNICPVCQRENDDNVKKCVACGVPLQNVGEKGKKQTHFGPMKKSETRKPENKSQQSKPVAMPWEIASGAVTKEPPMPEESVVAESIPMPEEPVVPESIPMPEEPVVPESIPMPEEPVVPENIQIPEEKSVKKQTEQRQNITTSDRNTNEKRGEISPAMIGGIVAIVVVIALIAVLIAVIMNLRGKSDSSSDEKAGMVAEQMAEEQDDIIMDVSLNDYDNGIFRFQLPNYWGNLTSIEYSEGSMSFFHRVSKDECGDGWLFTVTKMPTQELSETMNYRHLETLGDYAYIIVYPMYDTYSDNGEEEYQMLRQDDTYIMDSFVVLEDAQYINTDSEESVDQGEYTSENIAVDFILPYSDTVYLSEDDLIDLTAEELKIARNEIYARHGRKFLDANLQAYFNSKSWYVGTIEPEAFKQELLSEIERKNAIFISDYEEKMGY